MAALYFATTEYEEWSESGNWLSYRVDECSWFSTSDEPCTSNGQLETLDLTNNSLSGPLGPEIGYLRSVQYLYLPYNYLSGMIPTTIGSLTNLIDLDMFSSNLVGPIPTELGLVGRATCTLVYPDCRCKASSFVSLSLSSLPTWSPYLSQTTG